MGYWGVVKLVIKKADIILFVLDARMPEMSRNRELERTIRKLGKELVYVFNKIDLISKESLEKLRKEYPDYYFVSGIKNIGMKKLKTDLIIMGKRMGLKEIHVGIVGYPNVGKSAVINALAKRKRTMISPIAGTTRGFQLVKAGGLWVVDSPGVIPMREGEATLGILGAKSAEQIRNREKVAIGIINLFIHNNKKALEEYYGLDLNLIGDPYEILLMIGRKKGHLIKGGVVDENRTATHIIRDWQSGKLKLH